MNDRERLEEPPPILRSRAVPPVSRSTSPASSVRWWRRREEKSGSKEPGRGVRAGVGRTALLAVGGVVVVGLQGWTVHRLVVVQREVSTAERSLEEARGSLSMLWATTNRLDEDQMVRLAVLMDSIRSVSAYAQGEIRLWEAAYHAQEQRLDENAGRIGRNADAISRVNAALRTANDRVDALARADEDQHSRLAALEQEDQSHGSMLETLTRRAQAQESTVQDMSATVTSLRQNLAKLDSELVLLEEQLASSSAAYAQVDTRIERLAGWVEGFRRAGLSAEAVQGRLSSLADELRRVRMRVDSLRPVTAALVAPPTR